MRNRRGGIRPSEASWAKISRSVLCSRVVQMVALLRSTLLLLSGLALGCGSSEDQNRSTGSGGGSGSGTGASSGVAGSGAGSGGGSGNGGSAGSGSGGIGGAAGSGQSGGGGVGAAAPCTGKSAGYEGDEFCIQPRIRAQDFSFTTAPRATTRRPSRRSCSSPVKRERTASGS